MKISFPQTFQLQFLTGTLLTVQLRFLGRLPGYEWWAGRISRIFSAPEGAHDVLGMVERRGLPKGLIHRIQDGRQY